MTTKKAPRPAMVVKAAPKHPLMLDEKSWNKDKVIDCICDRLATSSKGLGSILADGFDGLNLPSYSTVMKWLDDDKTLSERYARGKDAQADYLGEEFLELHKKAWIPVMLPDGLPLMVDGKPALMVDKSSAAAVRLEADNKKWLMGKLKPKKYGDKLEHTGEGGGAIQHAMNIAVSFVSADKR